MQNKPTIDLRSPFWKAAGVVGTIGSIYGKCANSNQQLIKLGTAQGRPLQQRQRHPLDDGGVARAHELPGHPSLCCSA
jgi:hypothetical protein